MKKELKIKAAEKLRKDLLKAEREIKMGEGIAARKALKMMKNALLSNAST